MIDISVLDTDFNILGVIDYYESFIWTDRFRDYGDFELYTTVDSNVLNLCQQDYYLIIPESRHMMIIEGLEITTDAETGNRLKVTGRSLESILDRRIIWDQTTVSSGGDHTLKTAIEVLFKLCFGSNGATTEKIPLSYYKKGVQQTQTVTTRSDRVVPGLLYLRPAESTFIRWDDDEQDYVDLTIEKTQYTGDGFYEIMQDLCDTYSMYGLGYRLLPLYSFKQLYSREYLIQQIGDNIPGDSSKTVEERYDALSDYTFLFEMYTGEDRSYKQTENVYITFSPNFDNIINTDYLDSLENWKNVTLVLGEGEGTARTRLIVGGKQMNSQGQEEDIPALFRRELYTDARDLQSSDYGGKKNKKYQAALKQRGLEKLAEATRIMTYDGQVETTRSYIYDFDYFMGDIINIENEYGLEGSARVIEYIRSESSSGIECYPTFDSVELINDSTEVEQEGS